MPIHTADRSALLFPSSLEGQKRNFNNCQQIMQDGQDGLALVGLSPAKAYVEGNLILVAVFRDGAADNLNGRAAAPRSDLDVCEIEKTEVQPGDICLLFRRDQNAVFVCDVQTMKFDEISSIPSRVGLYQIEDAVDDFVARGVSRFFMSVNGPFCRLNMVRVPYDGKGRPLLHNVPVCLDQYAISVIESGPHIVERVSEYGGRMNGKWGADHPLPGLVVGLSSDCISVGLNMSVEKRFKLVDVLFGPFGL